MDIKTKCPACRRMVAGMNFHNPDGREGHCACCLHRLQTPNARFWVWWNSSWCKLTIRPGQTLGMYAGRSTDEGFAAEAHTYTLEDGEVQAVLTTWGRDCDGRHEWHWDGYCPISKLRADETPDGTLTPAWKQSSSCQRDEHAEMAGY